MDSTDLWLEIVTKIMEVGLSISDRRAPEKQECKLPKPEVDEVPARVGDERPKVGAHDALPTGAIAFVEFRLEESSDALAITNIVEV